jgi:dGTPase
VGCKRSRRSPKVSTDFQREVSAIDTPHPIAPWAMPPSASRGRRVPEAHHPYRSEYARDRDRIIHSRAFRRLEAKTQVFSTRFSDHFRNRLTHTIEVSQIARTVAGALGLNVDLAEALALVHDIGHPPFGHSGERKLNELMRARGSYFNHNLHALRIVEQFEHRYLEFNGLNLTFEVREGIVKHSRDYVAGEFPELSEYLLELRPPLESQLIDWVDEIAYNTADLDDALEANLLAIDVLRRDVPLFGEFYAQVNAQHSTGKSKLIFNEALRHLLDHLASDLISNTEGRVKESGAASVEDIRRAPARLAGFSEAVKQQNSRLKAFLFANIYNHPVITEECSRSVQCLEELFLYFLGRSGSMPESYEEMSQSVARHVVVCDYIAGMTDKFLLRQHREHLGESLHSSSASAKEPHQLL